MMIKANELRIGSLVYVLYKVSIITSINESDVDSHDCKDIPIEELRPIPITEEWLVKLGFERWKKIDMIKKCGDFKIVFEEHDKPICFLQSERMDDLKYIHQLQNLYFALTNEELTITQTNE